MKRDYKLLNLVSSDKMKRVEECMRKVTYTGESEKLLKDVDDRKDAM